MKTIQEFKKRYKLQNKDLAKLFGYKRTNSYELSSQKERFENATIDLVNMIDTDRVECFKKYLLEYKKACAALKTLNIDENDFIAYLKRKYDNEI